MFIKHFYVVFWLLFWLLFCVRLSRERDQLLQGISDTIHSRYKNNQTFQNVCDKLLNKEITL